MKTLIGRTGEAGGAAVLRRGAMLSALLAGLAGGADPLLAQEETGRREHVVRRGDTLWDLAGFYLNDPFRWPLLWEANREVVENPHWIYPEERLVIPPVPPSGAEQAGAEGAQAAGTTDGGELAGAGAEGQGAVGMGRTLFFGYGGAVEETGADAAAPEFIGDEAPVRLQVQPGEFYAAPWLDDPDELPVMGRYVGTAGNRSEDRLPHTAHPLDQVYLAYTGRSQPEVGERLHLVRIGRRVLDAGRVIEPTAILKVTSLERDVIVAIVEQQFEPVLPGQVALTLEAFPAEELARPAEPVEDGPDGVLLDFLEEQPLYATADKAFVSLGRRQGVSLGDEFVVFRPERPAREGGVDEPAEPVAHLKVVRVGETSATVRVVQVTRPVLKPGLPVKLVKKMP